MIAGERWQGIGATAADPFSVTETFLFTRDREARGGEEITFARGKKPL